jgi:CBS domain-containing protein
MKKCRDVMTVDPFCCLPADSVAKAAQSIKDLNVGSIPVVENENSEKLIGIITDRDITLNVVACNLSPFETRVQDAMSRDLIVCRPEDPVTEAINAMATHQVRRIPVVDEENKIVGIISQGDVALRLNDPETTGEVVAEISEQG